MLISIVSPVYSAEELVDELIERLCNTIETITDDFEIILVEDGSKDNSWLKIEENSKKNNKIKGIKLSRNFGQHYAITAGLDFSIGQWIVVMDCDLQDQPEEILKLFNKAQEGFQIVCAQRSMRQDSFIKRLGSYFFYKLLGYLTGAAQDHSIANFGIYHRSVIDSAIQMREKIRYFPSMIKWVGFKSVEIPINHAPRASGNTSYDFSKLLNLSIDIILAYSDKPLRLTIKLGLIISILSFCFAVYNVYEAMNGKFDVLGYASLITSIWLLGGIIIFIIGIVGLYIGKIFESVKNRPIYIIDKKTF
jgi:glycosyltransferase involved in cell wall biosynthesis